MLWLNINFWFFFLFLFFTTTPLTLGYEVEMRQKAPPSDGVSGYIVEKKPRRGGDWTKANSFPVEGQEYTCINLPEGAVYEFRVVAVNDAGPGKPSKPTEPHTVRDPVCTYSERSIPYLSLPT